MKTAQWLLPFTDKIIEAGMASRDSIIGCSIDEISTIESTLNLTLPATYKEFLLAMGHGAGGFLRDCSFRYPGILEFGQQEATVMLENSDSSFTLSALDYVCVSRDNLFFFFSTNKGEDPPVFRFVEDDLEPQPMGSTFSSWFGGLVFEEIENFKELQKLS